MIMKKQFFAPAIFGLVLGLTFTAAAFNEPTALPGSTTSPAPINLGAETQYRDGPLGIGDGTNLPSSTIFNNGGSLYIKAQTALDATTVRQSANLLGDTTVGGRTIIAGALRAGQVIIKSSLPDGGDNPAYNTSGERLYFAKGSTTNLGKGHYCELKSAGAACPAGSVLINFDPAASGGIYGKCRWLNPVASPGKQSC